VSPFPNNSAAVTESSAEETEAAAAAEVEDFTAVAEPLTFRAAVVPAAVAEAVGRCRLTRGFHS